MSTPATANDLRCYTVTGTAFGRKSAFFAWERFGTSAQAVADAMLRDDDLPVVLETVTEGTIEQVSNGDGGADRLDYRCDAPGCKSCEAS